MKGQSSSKKRRAFNDGNNQQMQTPKLRKSYSVTKTNYLQLQLDTSGKKRDCLEKNLIAKDKRIRQLELLLKERLSVNQDTSSKYKEIRGKYEHQKNKNQRLQQQLREAVQLCKTMKQKCNQLFDQNLHLQTNEQQLKARLILEEKKQKQLKQARKREKRQMRQLIMPLLQVYESQTLASSKEIQKIERII